MAKNWAICVGINHYDYNRPLSCGVNDAEKMKEFFEEAKFDKIYLFTDNAPPIPDMSRYFPSQPTYTKLYYWLGKRFKNVKAEKKKDKNYKTPLNISDNLWFFFSGHGWRHRGQDYLLLSDSNSDPDYIERSAIPISEVTNHLRNSGAGNIIMLIDACRDSAKKGGSIELSKEQGVIKISSCQPNELSYEVQPLNHGAFTFALLESLRLQGEGNCATLDRLCNRLRNRVKDIAWEYHKKTQIPYAAVEPETKYHLLLLPDYIMPNKSDLAILKADAFKAEFVEKDLKLAETIWTRLIRFDLDEALESLYRIRDKVKEQSSTLNVTEEIEPNPDILGLEIISEIEQTKSVSGKEKDSVSNPIDTSSRAGSISFGFARFDRTLKALTKISEVVNNELKEKGFEFSNELITEQIKQVLYNPSLTDYSSTMIEDEKTAWVEAIYSYQSENLRGKILVDGIIDPNGPTMIKLIQDVTQRLEIEIASSSRAGAITYGLARFPRTIKALIEISEVVNKKLKEKGFDLSNELIIKQIKQVLENPSLADYSSTMIEDEKRAWVEAIYSYQSENLREQILWVDGIIDPNEPTMIKLIQDVTQRLEIEIASSSKAFSVATIEKEIKENQNLLSRFLPGAEQWVINKQQKQAQGFIEELAPEIKLELMRIPGGIFWMGTNDEEIERLVKKFNWKYFRREKPQHQVTIHWTLDKKDFVSVKYTLN